MNNTIAAAANVNETMKGLNEYALYRVHKALLLYVPPIILAFGVVGNALAFAVLTRRTMRGVSAYVYLTVLSVTDTVVLVIGLLRMWLSQLTGYDVRNEAGPWMCKLLMMAGYTASDYAVWLIVAVTAERFVAVAWPLSALHGSIGSGVQRATVVVIILFVILSSINAHFLWTVSISQVGGGSSFTNHTSFPKCGYSAGYERLMVIWPWVDTVIYSLLPLLLLSVLNALIIYSVSLARQRRISLLATGGNGKASVAGGVSVTVTAAGDSSPERGVQRPSSKTQSSAAVASGGEAERLTVMLLAVSFTFLATTLPNCILLIVKSFRSPGWSVDMTLSVLVAQTIGEMLMYANHSVNFYLYCATGRKFRYQLIFMFTASSASARRRHQQENSVISTCTTRNLAAANTRVQQSADGSTLLTVMPPSNGSPAMAGSRTVKHGRSPSPICRRYNNSDVSLSTPRRFGSGGEQQSLLLMTDLQKITSDDRR